MRSPAYVSTRRCDELSNSRSEVSGCGNCHVDWSARDLSPPHHHCMRDAERARHSPSSSSSSTSSSSSLSTALEQKSAGATMRPTKINVLPRSNSGYSYSALEGNSSSGPRRYTWRSIGIVSMLLIGTVWFVGPREQYRKYSSASQPRGTRPHSSAGCEDTHLTCLQSFRTRFLRKRARRLPTCTRLLLSHRRRRRVHVTGTGTL